MSAEIIAADSIECPTCHSPSCVDLGDFLFCEACGLRWWKESEDLDVTETHPAIKLIQSWLDDEAIRDDNTWPIVEKVIRDNPV